MNVCFDGAIELELHGAKVMYGGGLLAYHELDNALRLFVSVSSVFIDQRTGQNIKRLISHRVVRPNVIIL